RISAQLDEALDSRALGRAAMLSPLHFHRVFRGIVGETPLELHRRLRMERAAYQLATSDLTVTRVAFDAGYETHEAFTRAFRQCHGATPSAFRRRARAPGHTRTPGDGFELPSRNGVHFAPHAARRSSGLRLSTGEPPMNVEILTMPELHLATL